MPTKIDSLAIPFKDFMRGVNEHNESTTSRANRSVDSLGNSRENFWSKFLPNFQRHHASFVLPENNLPALYQRLGELPSLSAAISVKELGRVEDLPIHVIHMKAKNSRAKKNVLVCAGVHGNEPSSVSAVFELIKKIELSPALRENVNFYILPCINPHGYKAVSRRNQNDVDLNRAFAMDGQVNEPEISLIKPFFKKTSFDLVLDLHSALPKRNGYFVLHRSDLNLLEPAMQQFSKKWPVLSNGSKPYTEQAPGICTSSPKGTLKDYLADRGCEHVVTLEAPRALPFVERSKGLGELAWSIIKEFSTT